MAAVATESRPSASLSLVPRPLPDALADCITALAVLIARYGESRALVEREIRISIERLSGGPPASIECVVDRHVTLARVRAHVMRQIGSNAALSRWSDAVVCLRWAKAVGEGEHEVSLAVCARLPEARLVPWASVQVGFVAGDHALAHLARHFRRIARATRESDWLVVNDVPLLDGRERSDLLDRLALGSVAPDLLRDERLVDIFAETVRAHPSRTAIVDGAASWSYCEVAACAHRIAASLRARGIGAGHLVGLSWPRGAELYVAMLGISMSGAAYVPIDPELPPERIAQICADARLSLLVADPRTLPTPAREIAKTVEELLLEPPRTRSLRPARTATPDDVCYVIYTSGSTGSPKGVAVTHRNVAHLVRAEQRLYGVTCEDRVFAGFSVAFDASVEEIWLAFASGAALVVGDTKRSIDRLGELLAASSVTVFSTVPTLLASLAARNEDLPTVRVLILGGEACPDALAARYATPGRAMWNTYGPTEATVIATAARVRSDRPVTLGRPIANYATYILDTKGEPALPGTPGEICIGGPGVARGYLGDPEKTFAKFIPNPHAARPGAPPTLYRTGDRGRFDDDGNIEFLGRLDDQIKVRGFRVELGEVEAGLLAVPGVRSAAAVSCQLGAEADGKHDAIAAFVVCEGDEFDECAFRSELSRKLAVQALPARLWRVGAVPTLPSGKLDRHELRRWVAERLVAERTVAPRDGRTAPPPVAEGLTETIRAAMARLLARQDVGPETHFFHELGAHSLLAAQLVSRLRELPQLRTLSVLDLYEHPTAASLAASVAPEATTPFLLARSKPHGAAETDVAPRSRHLRAAFVQAIALPMLFGLQGAQWLGPFIAFLLLHHRGVPLVGAAAGTLLTGLCMPWLMLIIALATKWVVVGRHRAGRFPLWGSVHLRAWFVERTLALAPTDLLLGTPLLAAYLRLLGARVGDGVTLASDSIGPADVVSIGDGSAIGIETRLASAHVEAGAYVVAPIALGARVSIGARSIVVGGASVEDDACVDELTMLPAGACVRRGERWLGSPARRAIPMPRAPRCERPSPNPRSALLFALLAGLVPVASLLALCPALAILLLARHAFGEPRHLLVVPIAAACYVVCFALLVTLWKRFVVGRIRPGRIALGSAAHLRYWSHEQLMQHALDAIGGVFATPWLSVWYRSLGARIGRGAEISTAPAWSPDLLSIGDEAFVADAAMLAPPRYSSGEVELAPITIGRRAFIGNSAVVPAGRPIDDGALLGCLSIPAPGTRSTEGRSFVGAPAIELPARERHRAFDETTTFRPRRALRALRAVVDLARIVLPPACLLMLGSLALETFDFVLRHANVACAFLLLGLITFAVAVLGAAIVVLTKWLLLGTHRPGAHALYSSFVMRNELVTALQENVADPLLNAPLLGTVFAPWFHRAMGAKIGRRAHLLTTCFTEHDLVTVGDDVALGDDATVQTHLFEDRVMKVGRVRIEARASVGADAIVLYDATMREGSTLGPLSLLMKGEALPAGSRWEGSPARANMR